MPYRTAKSGSIRMLFAAGPKSSRPVRQSAHKTTGTVYLLAMQLLLLVLVSGCEDKPTTSVPTTAGGAVNLAGSDWLVVNYWAEWCGPCRHEIPELNELDGATFVADDAQGESTVAISVVGVNYDGLLDARLTEVSDRMGIEFAVLATDPRERWQQPTPTVLPSTYLIAPGGEFVETLVGPQTRAGILSRIETLAKN